MLAALLEPIAPTKMPLALARGAAPDAPPASGRRCSSTDMRAAAVADADAGDRGGEFGRERGSAVPIDGLPGGTRKLPLPLPLPLPLLAPRPKPPPKPLLCELPR